MDHNDFKSQRLDGHDMPQEEEEAQCAGACAGLPKRSAFNFTRCEEVCLDVVREILSMYMSADARHWHSALEFTEMHLGDANSVSFVARVTNLVRALRDERRCPFNFLTFGCKHITGDELAMMSALRTARAGPNYQHKEALQYLAQSASVAKLEMAILQLAGLLKSPDASEACRPAGNAPEKSFAERHATSKLH